MKRIKAACICQTLLFSQKDDISRDQAALMVKQEVNQYKKQMEHRSLKYKILEETEQNDGSILLKIIKQYDNSPVGNYMD